MNKAMTFLESAKSSDIVYSTNTGLKLLRFGNPNNRFDQSASLHYNKAPASRGTWATIYPYSPFLHFPDQHDARHLDISDQSAEAKHAYSNAKNNPFLKPITFFWRRDIFSHIDKSGSYNNTGWTYYQNVSDLVKVIRDHYSVLSDSVQLTQMKSQNAGYPGSGIRYFQNHEYEVFIPHAVTHTT